MVLFPRKGDRLRAHSVFFQAMRVAESGKGVVTGMAPSRASSSSIAIAAGTWTDGATVTAYAGGSITSIPAASAGKHRYDLVVLNVSTGAISRIGGSEDTPTLSTDFLENVQPLPPELENANQALLGVIIVTSSGIPSGNYGHYATSGVADMIINIQSPAHASRHQSGGSDSIKLDDLAAPDDNTDLNVSISSHGLMPKLPNTAQRYRGDGDWATPAFDVVFPFGDGSAVLVGQQVNYKIPMASKIVAAEVTSRDATGDLLSGSVTCTIYIHDYNANADSVSASDSFALSSASSMRETGLNIAVAAGKRITCVISGITTCKQVDLTLDLEAT
jgi:hypothetical protein